MIKNAIIFISSSITIISISATAIADDEGKWFGKIYGGLSVLGDQTIDQTGVASTNATAKSEYDSGYMAGAAFGYNYTNNISVELSWDYITNGATNKFSDGTNFNDGDFSSSIFFLNSAYKLDPVFETKIRPYFGAGLGYVEEIDMDLTQTGVEESYSQDGKLAYQLMAGMTYPISESFDFDTSLRYVRIDNLTLESESGTEKLRNVDYNPVLFTVGATYKF